MTVRNVLVAVDVHDQAISHNSASRPIDELVDTLVRIRGDRLCSVLRIPLSSNTVSLPILLEHGGREVLIHKKHKLPDTMGGLGFEEHPAAGAEDVMKVAVRITGYGTVIFITNDTSFAPAIKELAAIGIDVWVVRPGNENALFLSNTEYYSLPIRHPIGVVDKG